MLLYGLKNKYFYCFLEKLYIDGELVRGCDYFEDRITVEDIPAKYDLYRVEEYAIRNEGAYELITIRLKSRKA